MTTVAEVFGSGLAYAQLKEPIFGLECEVESVLNGGASTLCFKCVQDGSLRNGGWEYTTSMPNVRKVVLDQFEHLFAKELKLSKDPHSERTSTHVHMNVSGMDMDHVKQMVLLYALFEEFFFSMVKPTRRDNIHCVPLTETPLPSKYNTEMMDLIRVWSKYTALNLGRMHDLGTVEFRHMHGTSDKTEMGVWLHVLENLWKVAQRIKISQETLRDHKTIEEWFDLIFFPADKIMMLKPSLFNIIQNSLIDVKFSVA